MAFLNKEITDKILKAYFNVYNELGYGFLEKVYEAALLIELTNLGLFCERQKSIDVFYKGVLIGNYFADIVVENKVILELKAVECLAEEHEFQLLNYLKATDIEVGLLLNFGKAPEFKRKAFSNMYKKRSAQG